MSLILVPWQNIDIPKRHCWWLRHHSSMHSLTYLAVFCSVANSEYSSDLEWFCIYCPGKTWVHWPGTLSSSSIESYFRMHKVWKCHVTRTFSVFIHRVIKQCHSHIFKVAKWATDIEKSTNVKAMTQGHQEWFILGVLVWPRGCV